MKIVREASELGLRPGQVAVTVQVGTRTFKHDHTISRDGDVVAWVYKPAPHSAGDTTDELQNLND
jgi:hypothetical protein